MWRVVMMVAVLGCGDDVKLEPDGMPPAADAQAPTMRCERWQDWPPQCRSDECPDGYVRACGNERVCQIWPDCPSGECYQCRVLYWCECH